jgi:hypothetical protein
MRAMIRPSDLPALPWWGWMFTSAGAWFICVVCQSFDYRDRDFLTIFFSFASGLVAIFAGTMGIILWVSNG